MLVRVAPSSMLAWRQNLQLSVILTFQLLVCLCEASMQVMWAVNKTMAGLWE